MEEKNETIVNMKGELVEIKNIPSSKSSFMTGLIIILIILSPVLIYLFFTLITFLFNCC